MKMSMPLGFRFDPSDDELIRGYLIPRLVGHVLPWDGIVETGLYEEAPWNVLSEKWSYNLWQNSKINSKKWIYVFTRLKKASAKKISRRAGCGTWDGQTGSTKVKDLAGKVIGSRKSFRYKSETSSFGIWTMHEYTAEGAKDDDFVLCKITKTTTTTCTSAGIKRGINSDNGNGDEKRQKLVEGNNDDQLYFDWDDVKVDELLKLINDDDQQNLQHQDCQQLN